MGGGCGQRLHPVAVRVQRRRTSQVRRAGRDIRQGRTLAQPGRLTHNAAMDEPSCSALIVAVAEAEPYVAACRDRFDQAASWGVPAHITVLYPFLAPAQIDERALSRLRQAAASVPAFFCSLAEVGWFGERVVWLAPRPARPFLALTAAVTARFPSVQPYDGAFDEVVPHLTLGHDHPVAELAAAADVVGGHLPIRARVTSMRLAVGVPQAGRSWSTREEFPLG